MKPTRNSLGILIVTALAVAGAVTLAAMRVPVPDYLTLVIVTGIGALAGIAIPELPTVSSTPTAAPAPVVDAAALADSVTAAVTAELARRTPTITSSPATVTTITTPAGAVPAAVPAPVAPAAEPPMSAGAP